MSRLHLTSWQRQRLRRQLVETSDARLLRRTLAVLEFDYGRPAADIARMLSVTRQSIYNWIEAYTQALDPSALRDEQGGDATRRWMRARSTCCRPSSPPHPRISSTLRRIGRSRCCKKPRKSPRGGG